MHNLCRILLIICGDVWGGAGVGVGLVVGIRYTLQKLLCRNYIFFADAPEELIYSLMRYLFVQIYTYEVKTTFELFTVHRQQHSFSTHERMFLWKCQSFWDRKYLDLRGTRTTNLRIHAECSNHLSYQGQTWRVLLGHHLLLIWRSDWFIQITKPWV